MKGSTVAFLTIVAAASVGLYAFIFIPVYHEKQPLVLASERYYQSGDPRFTLYYYRGVKHVSYSLSYHYFGFGFYQEWVDQNEWL